MRKCTFLGLSAVLLGLISLSASPAMALKNKNNLGGYVGFGLDRTNVWFTNRFTVSADLTHTDMALHSGAFATYLQGGYVFGGEELNGAFELNYHLQQANGAQMRFVPSQSIQSFGENMTGSWDVSFKPSVRMSRGTNLFARLGISQTTYQVFYRDVNLSTHRNHYKSKGWLWGFGVMSHLTDNLAVTMEYRTISPHSVTFNPTDPVITTITNAFSSLTNSASQLGVRHKIDTFSIGMVYFFA